MNHLTETLNRLSAILEKIEARAEELGAQGKDTAVLEEQVEEAKDLISEAQTAVSEQREEIYTFDVSEEDNLGSSVSAAIKDFRADVKVVFGKVRSARQAVAEALGILRGLLEETI